MRFAENTSVPVEKSKAEIEGLLSRYGASQFASGWANNKAVIQFFAKERRIRFVLPLPDPVSPEFQYPLYKGKPRTWASKLSTESAQARWDQACRQRWRALALAIKAKLEAVECGITSFEEEFYANIVLPGGKTLFEQTHESVDIAYKTGQVPPLLEWGK